VFAQDEAAVAQAAEVLRYTAGNFYVNDKPDRLGRGPAAVRRCPRIGHETRPAASGT
jgi:hypothetical protein